MLDGRRHSCLTTIMLRTAPFQFRTPCSVLIVGPSGSGKTVFTTRLLTDNVDLFTQRPSSIHYCYGSWQKNFETLKKKGVTFSAGVPTERDLDKWFPRGGLLVMDDLMTEGNNDKTVLDIFTKHSHHRNITVLYLCQDMFPPGKFAKSISRNAHYIVAFKNPRDQLGMRNVALQAFPDKWQKVLDAFRNATSKPFGYLVLDLHPASNDDQRLVSRLLKEEGYVRVYQLD